jgi:hypothetical protein
MLQALKAVDPTAKPALRAPRGPARIGVLAHDERAAIEATECVIVLREMRGHPVEDHADVVLVAVIDEPAEIALDELSVGATDGSSHKSMSRPSAPTERENRERHCRCF